MFQSNDIGTAVTITDSLSIPDYFPQLFTLVIFSFLVERILSVVFEMKFYLDLHERAKDKGIRSDKTFFGVLVSITLASTYELDVFSPLSPANVNEYIGYTLTGIVIAGGSKASLKLFRDYLDISSSAYKHQRELNKSTEYRYESSERPSNNRNIRNCIR